MNDHRYAPVPEGDLKKDSPRGSIAGGIAIAWIVLILGHIGMLAINGWQLLPVPEVLVLVLAAVFYRKSSPRTGQGVLLGLASFYAVVVLLVAACFGLVFSGAFR